MPVFNRGKVIRAALDGIIRERKENYLNLEIVVIDGGSTDDTVEIIKSYGREIDCWISEKDTGAADAFNKGVKAAKGEIIRYVASDDKIINGFTALMVKHLAEHPDVKIVGALANYYNVDEVGVDTYDLSKPNYTCGILDFKQVLWWTMGDRFSLIESWFIRRSIFDQVGHLNTQYKICPDYDFALRTVKAGHLFEVLPYQIINKYFYDDGSNLVSDKLNLQKEQRELIWKHAGKTIQGWIFLYCYPRPLHQRLYFSCFSKGFSIWLVIVKTLKLMSPRSYSMLQRTLKNKIR